jgi:hypothetical protein
MNKESMIDKLVNYQLDYTEDQLNKMPTDKIIELYEYYFFGILHY